MCHRRKQQLPVTNAEMIARKVNQFCLTCLGFCFTPSDFSFVFPPFTMGFGNYADETFGLQMFFFSRFIGITFYGKHLLHGSVLNGIRQFD